jgi:hypothetical protein
MANDFQHVMILEPQAFNPREGAAMEIDSLPIAPDARAVWYREHPVILRTQIMKKWIEMGGPKSSVGLPVDPNFPIKQTGDNLEVEFRGGSLKLNNVNAEIDESGLHHVSVTFEGFGLEMRQESGDEIYGQLVAQIGSTAFKRELVLPEVTLGPEDNNRIAQYSMLLYEGPPVDLNIVLSLTEHDSGDREAVRAQVRQKVGEFFDSAQNLAAGGVAGPAAQRAAQSLSAESLASSSLKDWMIDGAGDLINDLLGMGDDPYNPVGFTIYASEMQSVPPLRQYRCWSDPRVIDHTHARKTTCRDDGGDLGQITALFSVRPR